MNAASLFVGASMRRILMRGLRRQRGVNVWKLEVVSGSAPPLQKKQAGFTTWKNRRPRKYHRATYTLQVGLGWLCEQYPVSAMTAINTGKPMELSLMEGFKPGRSWATTDPESEHLYEG